ncbi:MAG: shikimate kinase [Flavobacteriales bacterium]
MENIYLVGFMGCGKSTIAEKLSKEINFKHIDTDTIIEEQNSMSISEIFKNKDEKYFRNEEYKVLEKILNQKRIVVSTGGGFVCSRDIMNKINKSNLSIYLKLTADNLHKRLKLNYKKRPLLSNIKEEKLKEFINSLLIKREEFYAKSNIVIDCNELNKEEILRKINTLI